MNLQPKILIIEDDQTLARTIKNGLSQHGFDCCYAINGAQVIEKAFEFIPDLILCDIKMHPIDGYQVFKILRESSAIDHVPFIFITANSDLQEMRLGMELGADDYIFKPIDLERLVRTIERRLERFNKIKEMSKSEFNALFNISPNGIFLFDGEVILEANPTISRLLNLKRENLPGYRITDFVDPDSSQKIREKISWCINGLIDSFSERICLLTPKGEHRNAHLYTSVSQKLPNYSLMIGLIPLVGLRNERYEIEMNDILKILRKADIPISSHLTEQMAEIFGQPNTQPIRTDSSFFTKRESQVLGLSMQGLPMKLIADKLHISDRTVEKYRARLMEKTNSNNMIEMIVYALKHNLINLQN